MKTKTAERARLERAYFDYVERYGRNAAVDAIESSTGTLFMGEVPDEKVVDALAALAKPPLVAQAKAPVRLSPADPSASVHDKLDAMAKSIYGRLRSS